MNLSKIISKTTAVISAAVICTGLCIPTSSASAETKINKVQAIETTGGVTISIENISTNNNKSLKFNNPISSDFFCADPTAVEYNGRLYLYGTNDHQQFEVAGPDVDNTYEAIKSMVVLSTDDMVNWVYHGEINIGEIAPWIMSSWAPTITSRVEADGKTHFYLYFSNNGLGTGVITSTDPVGPWSDPLGKPLISSDTPGLTDCPNPFDPGVVIDDNGIGWLSFGAGKASNGTDAMPGSVRIVQLGEDMLSFASDFKQIPAPYNFEASELNYINGTYVYTYNIDWSTHEEWSYDCPVPSSCSMVYMTTKTPLDPDSWEMRGECFMNPGTAGLDYCNNHTHMHKFKGKWYMFYHTLELKKGMGIKGAYRSLAVEEINVDESTVTIEKTGATNQGASSIVNVDPYTVNTAAELNGTANTTYDLSDQHNPIVVSGGEGSWISVRDVEFSPKSADDEPVEMIKTPIKSITYNFDVKSVDMATNVSFNPSGSSGTNYSDSVAVSGTGKYSVTCEIDNESGMMNMGFFKVDNDAQITFLLEDIVVNDKYSFSMASELTNTREWADGLKNIWNGFDDGATVYASDYASFIYSKSADSIEFFVSPVDTDESINNGPVVEEPLSFYATVKGTGRLEVRADSPTGAILSSVDFDTKGEYKTIYNNEVAAVGGVKDLYFVFSGSDIAFSDWCFAKDSELPESVRGDVNADGKFSILDAVMMQKYIVNNGSLTDKSKGDMNGDGRINIFDLSIMKSELQK